MELLKGVKKHTWDSIIMSRGGVNVCGIRWKTQACGAGRRDEQRRLEGGGFGRHSGERRYVTVKEVGSGCDREVPRQRPLLMGGGSREDKIKQSRKRRRQVVRGDRISCNN